MTERLEDLERGAYVVARPVPIAKRIVRPPLTWENVEVGQELAAFVDEIIATAKQVTGFAHALGINVGEGEGAATEQACDLVQLGLAEIGEQVHAV